VAIVPVAKRGASAYGPPLRAGRPHDQGAYV